MAQLGIWPIWESIEYCEKGFQWSHRELRHSHWKRTRRPILHIVQADKRRLLKEKWAVRKSLLTFLPWLWHRQDRIGRQQIIIEIIADGVCLCYMHSGGDLAFRIDRRNMACSCWNRNRFYSVFSSWSVCRGKKAEVPLLCVLRILKTLGKCWQDHTLETQDSRATSTDPNKALCQNSA